MASGIPCPRILSEPKRAISSDQKTAEYGHDHHQEPSGLPAGETEHKAEAMVVKQVGGKCDAPQEQERQSGCTNADTDGHA